MWKAIDEVFGFIRCLIVIVVVLMFFIVLKTVNLVWKENDNAS